MQCSLVSVRCIACHSFSTESVTHVYITPRCAESGPTLAMSLACRSFICCISFSSIPLLSSSPLHCSKLSSSRSRFSSERCKDVTVPSPSEIDLYLQFCQQCPVLLFHLFCQLHAHAFQHIPSTFRFTQPDHKRIPLCQIPSPF